MDLTPASLAQSPALPEHELTNSPPIVTETYHTIETPAAEYPSLTFLDFTFRPLTPHDPTSTCDVVDVDGSLEPMSHDTPWDLSGNRCHAASSASPSADTAILSADYPPFPGFDSCLPIHFAQDAYPPPPSTTLSRSPAPSLDAVSSGDSLSAGPRPSFGYPQDPSASAVKLEDPSPYSPSLQGGSYSVPVPVSHPYLHHGYPVNEAVSAWPKQEFERASVCPASLPVLSSSVARTNECSTARTAPKSQTRRSARRHTTREEANFQCQVVGCGKFFSRSYNFKSHMETHDEKRHYPFPCLVNDCSKKFVRKTDLQRHHQSVHIKERNHRCDYCGRMFARKDTLQR